MISVHVIGMFLLSTTDEDGWKWIEAWVGKKANIASITRRVLRGIIFHSDSDGYKTFCSHIKCETHHNLLKRGILFPSDGYKTSYSYNKCETRHNPSKRGILFSLRRLQKHPICRLNVNVPNIYFSPSPIVHRTWVSCYAIFSP